MSGKLMVKMSSVSDLREFDVDLPLLDVDDLHSIYRVESTEYLEFTKVDPEGGDSEVDREGTRRELWTPLEEHPKRDWLETCMAVLDVAEPLDYDADSPRYRRSITILQRIGVKIEYRNQPATWFLLLEDE